MKADQDTVKELSAAEHLKNMVASQGWQIAKAALDKEIIDLQMIGNVVGSTPDEKVKNMEARTMAVSILYTWLKRDVYGHIEQQEVTKDALRDEKDASFISRDSA
jgi:hypothetical protein